MSNQNVTCYITNRRKRHLGFLLQKNFVFGNYGQTEYVTNGNVENGRMLLYLNSGNGWRSSLVKARLNPIALMVQEKYGDLIMRKNEAYKGSVQELADIQAAIEKEAMMEHGNFLDVQVRRYDGKWKGSRGFCRYKGKSEANEFTVTGAQLL